jgi:hypothetical protein
MVSEWAEICFFKKYRTPDFACAYCMPISTVRACKEIS